MRPSPVVARMIARREIRGPNPRISLRSCGLRKRRLSRGPAGFFQASIRPSTGAWFPPRPGASIPAPAQPSPECARVNIEIVKSDAPRPLAHYSEGVVAGPWVFAAGQIASDYKTGVPERARRQPNFPY